MLFRTFAGLAPAVAPLFLLLGLLPASSAIGATIAVPADVPTIQGAIDLAVAGDVIEIGFVLLGKDDRFAPARGAPRAFSLKPPMGSTRPRSVTSPVRAARADSFTPSPIYPVRINGIVGTASWGRQLGVGIPPVRTLPQT